VYKELRIIGALGVDTASYEQALALLATHRYPFAEVARREVPLGEVEDLLLAMAGEGEAAPLHGVVRPGDR
jgi:alcohol dehydrogenase